MVRTEIRHDGGQLRMILDRPRGNVLTAALVHELRRALAEVHQAPHVRLVTIEGAGDHFSYGASVEEHRAATIGTTLGELHGLVRDLLACPAPTAAIVRGRCLGGAFELALACDLIFAGTTAVLGVPEIALGVFPPAAAALLPARVGASRAASAVLTGRSISADEWAEAGLIELVADPENLQGALDGWYETHLAGRSAAALRLAARACRMPLSDRVEAMLPRLEQLYLETLMRTHDAIEGIEAFIEKRQPQWAHA